MPDDLTKPLADRMRPRQLDEYIGQQHILKPGKPLYEAIKSGHLHSMIFWGPPGSGKTTLARIIAQHSDAEFIPLSAVLSGVKDIRDAVSQAKQIQKEQGRPTVLFVDEVHRFNKSQQDAFLPHVEDGTFYFVGATTENPSFALNNALLSRARVYVLNALTIEDLLVVLNQALSDKGRGLGDLGITVAAPIKQQFAGAADGDARRLLNLLEISAELALAHDEREITEAYATEVLSGGVRRFDNQGEEFYNQISALHKSVLVVPDDGRRLRLGLFGTSNCKDGIGRHR
jgi:putative ATPase